MYLQLALEKINNVLDTLNIYILQDSAYAYVTNVCTRYVRTPEFMSTGTEIIR